MDFKEILAPPRISRQRLGKDADARRHPADRPHAARSKNVDSLPAIDRNVVIVVSADYDALDFQACERAATSRIRKNLRLQLCVSSRARGSADRTGGGAALAADFKLVLQ